MSKAVLETEFGDIEFTLFKDRAPITAAYFLHLIKNKQLDATSFFRIVGPDSPSSIASVPIKVIQFGHWQEPTDKLELIEHENTNRTGLNHSKWSLSTARYGAGEVYRSFFVCLRDEPCFDFNGDRHPDKQGFAKFGEVTSGHSLLKKIYRLRSSDEFQQKPIKITSIRTG